jgi:hypothetical protein
MTMLDQQAGPSFEQMVHDGDDFRERISREIERAIGRVDETSPRAASSRAALHRMAATLPEVSIFHMMRLSVLDQAMNGAIMSTIRATLDMLGDPPLLDIADAGTMLAIFDGLIADLHRARLN